MAVDFLQAADFLRNELEEFYWAVHRGHDNEVVRRAAERLQAALDKVETLADDHGERWEHIPVEQRWGWLRLVSHVGTAIHELKKLIL